MGSDSLACCHCAQPLVVPGGPELQGHSLGLWAGRLRRAPLSVTTKTPFDWFSQQPCRFRTSVAASGPISSLRWLFPLQLQSYFAACEDETPAIRNHDKVLQRLCEHLDHALLYG